MIDQPISQTPRTDLATHIACSDLFGTLDPSTLRDLEKELELVRLVQGDHLCRQGDPGDSMFVLIEGCLGVSIENPDGTVTGVDRLQPGANVGEMALLTGQERKATVYAEKDSELVKLSRAGFGRIAEQQPQMVARLTQATIPRLQRTYLSGILTNLFGELDAEAVHYLQDQFEWRRLPSGAILFRQGDRGDDMYIVVNGRIRFVLEKEDGSERALGEVSAGEMIGEFALLTDEVRSATAYAIRDTDVVRLSRSTFEQLIMRYPQALMQITRLIVNKQRAIVTSEPESATAITIAVAPTSPSVPLPEFAHRLAEVLATFGSTLHLNREHFDRRYGKLGAALTPEDHPLNMALVAWLSEQERKVQYLVYETDPECSAWTMRCLRQADRILLVGVAESDPAPGEIEMACQRLENKSQTELVLLQPESIKWPSGTRHWLEQRQVAAHHHVRVGNLEDMGRLARRLTGHALGLVLGGGGARGFGHVGVLRAMREAGVTVNEIGGTSMGALIAAAFAMGMDDVELKDLGLRIGSRQALLDRTLPIVSLYATRKITKIIHRLSGGLDIEDLWLPYFCISCNLSRGEQMVHTRGPLWRAVRASMAAAPIFTPILYDGDLLVDGGILNNVPVDVMRERLDSGTVLGVDCSPISTKTQPYEFGPSISTWEALCYLVVPALRRKGPPNMAKIFSQIMDTNGLYRQQFTKDAADLILQLPTREYGMLDFEHSAEFIEIGYRWACEHMADWLPLCQKS